MKSLYLAKDQSVSFAPLLIYTAISAGFAVLSFFPMLYLLVVTLANPNAYSNKYPIIFAIALYLLFFGHIYFLIKQKLGIIFWSISALIYLLTSFAIPLGWFYDKSSFHNEQIVLLAYILSGLFISLAYLMASSQKGIY